MNEFMRLAMSGEKTLSSWRAGWDAVRGKTAMEPLGVELVDISDDRIVLEFEITDAARQPMGLLHGGVSVLVGESAASMHAAWLADLKEVAPVGVDINGTHLRSATEGRVRATGRVLRLTRSFVFHEVEIELIDSEALLCKARITNFFRPHS